MDCIDGCARPGVAARLKSARTAGIALTATPVSRRKFDMTKKRHALVTGANKGIGLAITKGLAQLGMTVWMGMRDRARGEEAVSRLRDQGLDVRFLRLDVADDTSVNNAFSALEAGTGALDVLVNNAGIASDTARLPSQMWLKDMKSLFEVNLYGPVRVTQAALPLLKAAPAARVVMMSSGLGSLTLIKDPTSIYSSVNLMDYTASKAALNAVTVSFAKELEPFGIKVNAADPGSVRTDINANTGALTPEEGAATALKLALLGADGPTGGFFASHGRQPW